MPAIAAVGRPAGVAVCVGGGVWSDGRSFVGSAPGSPVVMADDDEDEDEDGDDFAGGVVVGDPKLANPSAR